MRFCATGFQSLQYLAFGASLQRSPCRDFIERTQATDTEAAAFVDDADLDAGRGDVFAQLSGSRKTMTLKLLQCNTKMAIRYKIQIPA
jgi:hypothetical protein